MAYGLKGGQPRPNMNNSQPKKIKARLLPILLGVLFGAVAITSLSLFLFYNKRSREAVQAEREDYTTEIAIQLTRNIDNLQNSYANEVQTSSTVLAASAPQTLAAVRSMFPDGDSQHFLVSEKGNLVDTEGNSCAVSDENFATNVAHSTSGTVLSLTTVNLTDNYLLFGEKINPLTIEGVSYTALAIGVTTDQFRKNMTISLFDGVGAGYLIAQNGEIFIKPDEEKLILSGYNLFYTLKEGGASETEIQKLKDGMKTGGAKATVSVDEIQWIIELKSTQFQNEYIVVAVPLTLTAATTYLNMTLTIVFAFVFVTALAGIMTIILLAGLKRRQEEDKKAAAVDAQTAFLAKMSHDIRTPLNAVNGMLQLASDPRHSREEVNDFVNKAGESANYLLELVNGMLDLQKINSGKMSVAHEPFSMGSLLEGIDSMYRPVVLGKGLRFLVEGKEGFDSDYLGDQMKVKEILMNLLSNAVKFTPKGGQISVICTKKNVDPKYDEVTLVVRDTGIGMSQEFQSHMFTPFEQEKSSASSGYVGTGLGLSIVKSFSELMGGSVSVVSNLGEGSAFTVKIPLERTGTVLPKKAKNTPIEPFHHERVLLAEDNAINQQIAVMLLKERLALEVDAVDNGQEAVDAFVNAKEGTYAAILLDLRMPVLDGLGAAKAIRASKKKDAKTIPMIALSANAYAEDVQQSLAAGMNAHLAKPIDLVELSNKLHEYLPTGKGE